MLLQTNPDGKQTHYIYGLGLIGQEDENGYRSYHYDLRGSTVALSNQSGIITDTFQYGTYGELVNHTGTTSTPFLYNGRDGVMTDLNGLYYMRARYYNPEIKRFVNQDVLTGDIFDSQSLNRYGYVKGEPISHTDPFGLKRKCQNYAQLWDEADWWGRIKLVPGMTWYVWEQRYLNARTQYAIQAAQTGLISYEDAQLVFDMSMGYAVFVGASGIRVFKTTSGAGNIGKLETDALKRIGTPAENSGIRAVKGNANDAWKFFRNQVDTSTIKEVKPGVFVGEDANGLTFTYRAVSKSGPPTIDISGVSGLRKIKFID